MRVLPGSAFASAASPIRTQNFTANPFRLNKLRLWQRCAGACSSQRLSAFSAVATLGSPLLNAGRQQVRSNSNQQTKKQPRICARGGACDVLFVAETRRRTKWQHARSDSSQRSTGARSGRVAVARRNGWSGSVVRRLPTDAVDNFGD